MSYLGSIDAAEVLVVRVTWTPEPGDTITGSSVTFIHQETGFQVGPLAGVADGVNTWKAETSLALSGNWKVRWVTSPPGGIQEYRVYVEGGSAGSGLGPPVVEVDPIAALELAAHASDTTDVHGTGTVVTSSNIGTHLPAIGSDFAPMMPGAWYGPNGGAGNLFINTMSQLGYWTFSPFYIAQATPIDALGMEVTTAVAGSLARLGIYRLDTWGAITSGAGLSGTLLVDAGTADCSTTGNKILSFASVTIPARTWILVGQAGQGTAAGYQYRALRQDTQAQGPAGPLGLSGPTPNSFGQLEYRQVTVVTPGAGSIGGALPATLGATGVSTNRITSGVLFRRA